MERLFQLLLLRCQLDLQVLLCIQQVLYHIRQLINLLRAVFARRALSMCCRHVWKLRHLIRLGLVYPRNKPAN